MKNIFFLYFFLSLLLDGVNIKNCKEKNRLLEGSLKDLILCDLHSQQSDELLKLFQHVNIGHLLYWPPILDTVKDENFESVLYFIVSLCKKYSIINKKQRKRPLTILDKILKLDGEKFKADKDGKTPFHLASHHCNDNVAELLLKKCDDVNHTYNDNKTPLHYAVQNGTRKKVEKILRHVI